MNPEDGGTKLFRNVCKYLPVGRAFSPETFLPVEIVDCVARSSVKSWYVYDIILVWGAAGGGE
jgi:hypothetical protein